MKGLVIGVGLAALLAAGAVEATLAARRADPEHARAVQAKLDALPTTLGGWTGAAREYDPKVIRQTGAVAHLGRTYRRAGTGDEVDLLLLAGDPGEVGAHDPTRCYAGAGYRAVGLPQKREVLVPGGAGGGCWTARFDADTYPASAIQVNWAWSADGHWQASDEARRQFLGTRTLYKLYATRRLTAADGDARADPTQEFLADFLPAFRAAVAAE